MADNNMIIPRKSKPLVIPRRKPLTTGGGWPMRPGFPYYPHESRWHLIEIGELRFPWLWLHLVEMWDCGMSRHSPEVMGRFNYKGLVSIVNHQPPSEDMPQFFRRRRRA